MKNLMYEICLVVGISDRLKVQLLYFSDSGSGITRGPGGVPPQFTPFMG